MKCFATIAILACVAVSCAEPPPPQSQYLPPNQQQQTSNNYLPPTQSYQSPANNYLPPQRNQGGYSGGQQQNLHNTYSAPQQQQAAPAITSAIFPKQPQHGGGGFQGGYPNRAQSENSVYGAEENYGPAKYEFKYDVQDYESGNDFGHMESRDGDRTVGRYYVLLPDGRKQIVDYEADQNGYRPTISYDQTNNNNAGGGRNGYQSGYDNNAQQNKFNGYN